MMEMIRWPAGQLSPGSELGLVARRESLEVHEELRLIPFEVLIMKLVQLGRGGKAVEFLL